MVIITNTEKNRLSQPERCYRCKQLMYYTWQLAGIRNNKHICRSCLRKERLAKLKDEKRRIHKLSNKEN